CCPKEIQRDWHSVAPALELDVAHSRGSGRLRAKESGDIHEMRGVVIEAACGAIHCRDGRLAIAPKPP
ncbi:MAG TPA: hypothetical protein VN680_08525, partial [Burkholderiaceae bacterium]|nr:hypothetical protein [Burkholderiaceae bacterium]